MDLHFSSPWDSQKSILQCQFFFTLFVWIQIPSLVCHHIWRTRPSWQLRMSLQPLFLQRLYICLNMLKVLWAGAVTTTAVWYHPVWEWNPGQSNTQSWNMSSTTVDRWLFDQNRPFHQCHWSTSGLHPHSFGHKVKHTLRHDRGDGKLGSTTAH